MWKLGGRQEEGLCAVWGCKGEFGEAGVCDWRVGGGEGDVGGD